MALQYNVSFVTLASSNLDQLVAFYQCLFGLPPTLYVSKKYAEFQLLGLRLAIFQPQSENASEFMASRSGKVSICLDVKNLEHAIEAIEAAYESLSIEPGDRPTMGKIMTPSHGREIYAYDMDGNRLLLHEASS